MEVKFSIQARLLQTKRPARLFASRDIFAIKVDLVDKTSAAVCWFKNRFVKMIAAVNGRTMYTENTGSILSEYIKIPIYSNDEIT